MKKIFAANWKLNKNPSETKKFLGDWAKQAKDIKSEVWFFPTAVSFSAFAEASTGLNLKFGLQNTFFENQGAFTGENSAQFIVDLAGHGGLVGHSERRQIFSEDDITLSKKVQGLQKLKLTPFFCIGETLEQRQQGKTREILAEQIKSGLQLADRSLPVVVAYEPVWAIGTGVVASIEQVRETHQWVREELDKQKFSSETPILYGGSVKADNAKELIQIPHVDGFLVGGAALQVESFLAICNSI